jgi:hypothetical protein
MELWVNELWLLATAVVFTVYGWYTGTKHTVEKVSEAVIDSLIEQQYLKTKRSPDGEIEVLKWNEDS